MRKKVIIKITILMIILICSNVFNCVQAADKTNILFIGNSKTYYNDFAEIFMNLANKAGKNVYATDPPKKHGGKGLIQMLDFSDVKQVIKSKNWDYIVLQEKTDTGLDNGDELKKGAKELINYTKENSNTKVKVLYNAVWVLNTLNKNEQEKTNKNYELARNATTGKISYAGDAFIKCREKYPEIKLFVDDRHPTPEGSYLSACCMYATIYGESPEGIEYYGGLKNSEDKNDIGKEVAKKLQKIAAETMGVRKAESEEAELIISKDREPRVSVRTTNKDFVEIILHDNAGIDKSKTKLTSQQIKSSKQPELTLIQASNGVYTKNGERIKDLESYSGDKYNYGFKVKKSLLSTENKDFYLETYDYRGNCYLKEKIKIRRYKKPSSSGKYYAVNRAPRMNIKVQGNELVVYAIDYTGIKSINVTTLNNESLLKVSGLSTSKNSFNTGTISSKSYYTVGTSKAFDLSKLNDAKYADGKYKVKVVAEDASGVKSTKTMIIKIKNETNDNANW